MTFVGKVCAISPNAIIPDRSVSALFIRASKKCAVVNFLVFDKKVVIIGYFVISCFNEKAGL